MAGRKESRRMQRPVQRDSGCAWLRVFFFSSRRRHTSYIGDWSSDVCSSDLRLLRPILERERPNLIYLPHPLEWHPDHKAVLPMVRAALRRSGFSVPQIRGYEVWTPLTEAHCVERSEERRVGKEGSNRRARCW